MKNLIELLSLLLSGLFYSICIQASEERVYTIGIVPQFEIRHIRKIWNLILREIEKNIGIKLKLIGSPTIPDFKKEIHAGKFDFAYMDPYHMLLANISQGYIPLVKDNARKLHGILVIRRDSDIKTVKDLNGKKIAFPSPNALGSSLLIRANLAENYHVKVNPVYVKTHSSVYLNVKDYEKGIPKEF